MLIGLQINASTVIQIEDTGHKTIHLGKDTYLMSELRLWYSISTAISDQTHTKSHFGDTKAASLLDCSPHIIILLLFGLAFR